MPWLPVTSPLINWLPDSPLSTDWLPVNGVSVFDEAVFNSDFFDCGSWLVITPAAAAWQDATP